MGERCWEQEQLWQDQLGDISLVQTHAGALDKAN